MDQSLSSAGRKLPPSKAKAKRRPSDHQAAALQNELLLTKNNSGEIAPRGGRNPFKVKNNFGINLDEISEKFC